MAVACAKQVVVQAQAPLLLERERREQAQDMKQVVLRCQSVEEYRGALCVLQQVAALCLCMEAAAQQWWFVWKDWVHRRGGAE